MNIEWKSFLENSGAEFNGDELVSFGNAERERRATLGGDVMCVLPQYKTLAIVGDDAKTFLQGQLINDTSLLNDKTSQLSGLGSSLINTEFGIHDNDFQNRLAIRGNEVQQLNTLDLGRANTKGTEFASIGNAFNSLGGGISSAFTGASSANSVGSYNFQDLITKKLMLHPINLSKSTSTYIKTYSVRIIDNFSLPKNIICAFQRLPCQLSFINLT